MSILNHGLGFVAADVAIDEDLFAGLAAEEAVGGYSERLAGQIPERDIDAGQRRLQDRPPTPEGAAEEILPEVLDAGGILANEQRTEVVEGVDYRHRTTGERGFAEAVKSVFGGDFDEDELVDGEHIDGGDFHGYTPLLFGLGYGNCLVIDSGPIQLLSYSH